MIITCEECSTRFNLDEALLKPEGSKVRCSRCKSVFTAVPPQSEPVIELSDPAPPSFTGDDPPDPDTLPREGAPSPEPGDLDFEFEFEDPNALDIEAEGDSEDPHAIPTFDVSDFHDLSEEPSPTPGKPTAEATLDSNSIDIEIQFDDPESEEETEADHPEPETAPAEPEMEFPEMEFPEPEETKEEPPAPVADPEPETPDANFDFGDDALSFDDDFLSDTENSDDSDPFPDIEMEEFDLGEELPKARDAEADLFDLPEDSDEDGEMALPDMMADPDLEADEMDPSDEPEEAIPDLDAGPEFTEDLEVAEEEVSLSEMGTAIEAESDEDPGLPDMAFDNDVKKDFFDMDDEEEDSPESFPEDDMEIPESLANLELDMNGDADSSGMADAPLPDPVEIPREEEDFSQVEDPTVESSPDGAFSDFTPEPEPQEVSPEPQAEEIIPPTESDETMDSWEEAHKATAFEFLDQAMKGKPREDSPEPEMDAPEPMDPETTDPGEEIAPPAESFNDLGEATPLSDMDLEENDFSDYDTVLEQDTSPAPAIPVPEDELPPLPEGLETEEIHFETPPSKAPVTVDEPPAIPEEESQTQEPPPLPPRTSPLIEKAGLDQEPPAKKHRKKMGMGAPIKVLATLFFLLVAVYVVNLMAGLKLPLVSEIKIPMVEQLLKKETEPAVELPNPRPDQKTVIGRFVTNDSTGDLFIITGQVENPSTIHYTDIQVKGTLLKAGKVAAVSQVAFCGNIISEEVLKSGNIADITAQLTVPAGISTNAHAAPGATVPFMLVFSDLPEDLKNFTVEVANFKKRNKN